MYWIAEYLSYTFRCIKTVLKIIKAGVYPDFRRLANQYYNLLLPRITYFVIYLKLPFNTKVFEKR